eukprot:5014195-Heterocapsa_arctica.AAC.1
MRCAAPGAAQRMLLDSGSFRIGELKELPLIVSDGIESVQKKADEDDLDNDEAAVDKDDLSAKAPMPQEEAPAVLTATAQKSAKKAKK